MRAIAVGLLLLSATARAEYSEREALRPLVLDPGMTEAQIGGE